MAAGSAQFHESTDRLSPETMDRHRAIVSLQEELEAVDWYEQRIEASDDAELAAILAHNRDEEKEHAAMVLEWIRRRDPALDEQLRHLLFSAGSITDAAEDAEAAAATASSPVSGPGRGGDGSLGIGSLRDKEQL